MKHQWEKTNIKQPFYGVVTLCNADFEMATTPFLLQFHNPQSPYYHRQLVHHMGVPDLFYIATYS